MNGSSNRDIERLMEKLDYHERAIKDIHHEINVVYGISSSKSKNLSTRHLYAIDAMVAQGFNKTKIAKALGITRLTLYRHLDEDFRLKNNEKVKIRMRIRKRSIPNQVS